MNAKATSPQTISTMPLNRSAASQNGFPWGKLLLLALLAALGYGVYMRLQAQPMQGPGFGMGSGPVPVDVMTVEEKPARLWTSFSARLTAVEQAEIRPQVGGRITRVNFTEGAWVKKGQPLFTIDSRPYQAQVTRAEAAVAAAETKLHLASLELSRARALIAKQAIAQRVVDERENDYRLAESEVQAARAALLQATVDLDHAFIEAPISGRAGRPELTVGNVVEVGGQQAPLLTTIVDSRKLYAEFNVDEETYISLLGDSKPGKDRLPVKMTLGEHGDKVYEGYLSAFDNSFNTTSGTIRARAVFDNKDGELVPGLFATVMVGTAQERPVLTVPETALNTDQTKKYVFVVDENSAATFREVTLGQVVEGGRVVTSGLNVGDKIVVSGLQRIRPGAPVQPLTPFDKTGLVPAATTTPEAATTAETKPEAAPAAEEKPEALKAVFKDEAKPAADSLPKPAGVNTATKPKAE